MFRTQGEKNLPTDKYLTSDAGSIACVGLWKKWAKSQERNNVNNNEEEDDDEDNDNV